MPSKEHPAHILVVDDEKNIRLTVRYALERPEYHIDTAVNGEEALQKLTERPYQIMLLDLRMPGMDGMEVLRHVARQYPQTRVVIITAHGTVENAVEAMKLGAVDFIQKPFTPQELRDQVATILAREEAAAAEPQDYEGHLQRARRLIATRDLEEATAQTRAAVALDPSRPEAFNLLGVLCELSHDLDQARKHYRVALDLDPTYEPARANLNRLGDRSRRFEPPNLG
ncbi:MAG: response regulator [Caldilineae bacterium]|nr:MAG: response regulator [Caldilineae bacterium]